MSDIATENKVSPQKKPKKGLGIKLAVCGVVAVALVVGGILLSNKIKDDRQAVLDEELRQSIINSGTFHPGITVQGVDVAGMTPTEAAQALKESEQALADEVFFRITDGEHTYVFDQQQFDITYDTQAVLAEAIALGRDGDLPTLQAELADIAAKGRRFSISYTAVPRDAEGFVAEIAAELDLPAVDATFSVKQLELNKTTNALDVVNLGLTDEEEAAGMDLRDKRFDFVEGTEGYSLNQEELVARIEERAAAYEYGEINFELAMVYPAVTITTLKHSLVLRGSAYTSYAKGNYGRDTRVHNMTKACGLIYGTTLQPGDVLSCNDLLGPRYEKYGWQLAPAVIEGGANTEDQPGGGVCQVSTTMYNAVLKGDYQIVYRQAHSSRLSYVSGGLDATINTGTIDFKWSNNTEAPIYVFTWIDKAKKRIWCEIYALPFSGDFDEIALLSEELEPIPPTPDEYIPNASLTNPYWMVKNEAKKGYVYDTFKIYKKDGTELRREMITNTIYKMHPNRYFVWPDYVPGTPLLAEYKLTPVA